MALDESLGKEAHAASAMLTAQLEPRSFNIRASIAGSRVVGCAIPDSKTFALGHENFRALCDGLREPVKKLVTSAIGEVYSVVAEHAKGKFQMMRSWRFSRRMLLR